MGRAHTQRYRSALGSLAVRQSVWALFVWGMFYLWLWIAAGFRGSRAEP